MEFISRLFGAFLSLFFADSPFPLDDNDHIPVQNQEPVVPNFLETPVKMDESFLVSPNFERRWDPVFTSTPKTRRLFSGPKRDQVIPEWKVVKVQLPLERYLCDLKATGGCKSSKRAPAVAAPVKRMGLRV
jgi:hypothetical protein